MNENLNLCEILKHCPAGTKFWSPVWGDVFLVEIKERIEGKAYMPIVIKAFLWDSIFLFRMVGALMRKALNASSFHPNTNTIGASSRARSSTRQT